MKLDNWIIGALLAALVMIIVVLVATAEARAHDALPTAAQPEGWKYPFKCCSGYDCRKVDASVLKETPSGAFIVRKTGEYVNANDRRILDSPDDELHWCSVNGREDGDTICIFRPPSLF